MAGENDILTRDDNGDLAVRTVSSTESSTVVNPDDVYTRDSDGNLAVRVVGSGGGSGGDQHNLGYYATQAALEEAHPTAEAGDWAIVGATDTVWIWDTDNSEWVDSDQKGQVTSVNNQTGDVTVQETLVSGTNIKTVNNTSLLGSGNITIDSLPTQTGNSGKFLTTDGTDASWGSISFPVSSVNNKTGAVTLTASDVGALPDNTHIPADPVQADWNEADSSALDYIKNKPTIPTVNNATLTITQGGTTKGTFTANAGTDVTIDVDAGGSSLPSQSGNAGKFLTTDGTDASWGTPVVATFRTWGANE